MEQKTSRQIVSKSKYVGIMAKKLTIGTLGLYWILMGLLLFAAMCLMLGKHRHIDNRVAVLAIGACAAASVVGYVGARLLQTAEKIGPGVPLTRANTTDLPAPETLVRSSTQPMQGQEGVLLRAAAPELEKHAEQLLQAANKEE